MPAKETLYRLGVDSYRAYLLIAWAQSPAGPDDRNWHSAFTLPDRWQAPSFPLRGPDIMALGELKGPEIGEALRRLERDWIESGFGLTREQLLAKARALIAERR
jgi:poly(A) polymerase